MIRVLVVDDHPVLRAGLEAVLRAEPGFIAVGGAADGLEMQELVARGAPDVVVLDRHLAREDGIELCRALRRRHGAPAVVLYTACDDHGLEATARAAGAFALVEKAAAVDELFDAVRLAARAVRAVALTGAAGGAAPPSARSAAPPHATPAARPLA
jgi:DNA-binding NarL/FixJ family response regulator